MKRRDVTFFVIAVVVLAGLAVPFLKWNGKMVGTNPIDSNTPTFDQNISDGTISLSYPSDKFALAVNSDQILVHSYIPPCDENFDYCLYYKSEEYKGTNFESAGIRVKKRTDFATSDMCLNTPPLGFDPITKPDSIKTENTYSSSIFSNVGSAGAGHLASGSLYRLFIKNNLSCYEFETRIGQTQFLNYPPGTIKEFTSDDVKNLNLELLKIINQISLPSGQKDLLK